MMPVKLDQELCSVWRVLAGEGGLSPPLLCLVVILAICVPVAGAVNPGCAPLCLFLACITFASFWLQPSVRLSCGRKQYQNHFLGQVFFQLSPQKHPFNWNFCFKALRIYCFEANNSPDFWKGCTSVSPNSVPFNLGDLFACFLRVLRGKILFLVHFYDSPRTLPTSAEKKEVSNECLFN